MKRTNWMGDMKPYIIRMIQEDIDRETLKARTKTAQAMMAATLITLHDKWNWEAKDLVQIMNEIFAQFDCVADKYVTVEDFYKELEGLGITLT